MTTKGQYKQAYEAALVTARELKAENAKLREVIDDMIEVVEVSDPALVRFIAKKMKRIRTEEDA